MAIVKDSILDVLVVDDNEINSLILTNMLKQFGLHTKYTSNGKDAVALCQSTSFDMIFIDHIMPDMDGEQTTKAIRSKSSLSRQAIIVALSSEVTNDLKRIYRLAGADEIYKKPFELSDFKKIIRKYDLKIPISNQGVKNNSVSYHSDIIEASLKDMRSCNNIMVTGYENNSFEQLHMGIHKLKNVFSNLGQEKLLKQTRALEKNVTEDALHSLLMELEKYRKQLEKLLVDEKALIQEDIASVEPEPMSEEEYEQCLINTIYYIRRYEYDSIIKELQHLIIYGPSEDKQDFSAALFDIKEFHYERALSLIMNIKNKTGKLTVPSNKKLVMLDNFWD